MDKQVKAKVKPARPAIYHDGLFTVVVKISICCCPIDRSLGFCSLQKEINQATQKVASRARVLLKVDSCDYLKFSDDPNDINDAVLVEYICHITDKDKDKDKQESHHLVQTIHCLILKKFREWGYCTDRMVHSIVHFHQDIDPKFLHFSEPDALTECDNKK